MSEALAEFCSGPHDGLVLSMEKVRRYCHLVKMRRGDEQSIFALMPGFLDLEPRHPWRDG